MSCVRRAAYSGLLQELLRGSQVVSSRLIVGYEKASPQSEMQRAEEAAAAHEAGEPAIQRPDGLAGGW